MFEFDLQRFDEDTAAQSTSSEVAQSEPAEEKPIPEELHGLPEDIARQTLNEWEAMQKLAEEPSQGSEQPQQEAQPAQEPKPQTEDSVPYVRFKEKVDEANQLKALLAQYQQQVPPPAPQPRQAPPPQPQQGMRITPEVAKRINAAIVEEAKSLSGLTQADVDELQFTDEDDEKYVQWEQAKAIARNSVFTALRNELASRQQQAQQFLSTHQAAVQAYNDFVQKEFATVPNIKEIQNFAAVEFFNELPPSEQVVLADSYLRVERKTASPAELLVVQKYYERAKAAFNARAKAAKNPPQTAAQRAQQAQNLPRADQLKGASSKNDGQLSARDIEKLLEGDFTKIDPKTQRIMLGLS